MVSAEGTSSRDLVSSNQSLNLYAALNPDVYYSIEDIYRKCYFCDIHILQLMEASIHLSVYHGRMNNGLCSRCDMFLLDNLNTHSCIEKVENLKKVYCFFCNRRNLRANYLKTHITEFHGNMTVIRFQRNGDKYFVVPVYHEESITNRYPTLIGELRLKELYFRCEKCDILCISRTVLRQHFLSEHNINEAIFCENCRNLIRSNQYLSHRCKPISFFKGRFLICFFCTREFRIKYKLIEHIEEDHSEIYIYDK